jgi:hypothetical protein
MSEEYAAWRIQAQACFERARWQAFLETLAGRLRGRPADLLSFETLRERLDLVPVRECGLREIPLDSIVGSVGKCHEFTRSFLPRTDSIKDRWKQIYVLALSFKGLPPIQVYQFGTMYFVQDGHQRVSVARCLGAKTIEAYVIEFARLSPVPANGNAEERSTAYADPGPA